MIQRIALVNGNETKMPSRVAPLGLAFIASHLKSKGINVKFFDCPFNNREFRKLHQALTDFSPDIIGIGIRNLDNSSLHGFKTYLKTPIALCEKLRNSLPETPIIVGGSAVTVDCQKVLDVIQNVHLMLGEGEAGFDFIIEAINRGNKLSTIISNDLKHEPFRVNDISSLVLPRLYSWVDISKYLIGDAGYPVQTKRGCPLKCTYCTYPAIEGTFYRLIPPAKVADEISAAYNSGVKDFEFVDSTFNLPLTHAKAVVNELSSRSISANFVGTGINPINLDEELLSSMKKIGFDSVMMTAESGSESMLKSYKKGFDKKTLVQKARMVNSTGIIVLWNFLLGGPGETEETVDETLDFIDKDMGKNDVVYITSGVRIYPGSKMFKQWQDGKFDQTSIITHEKTGDLFYHSSQISIEGLREKLKEFRKNHPNIIFADEGHDRFTSFALKCASVLRFSKPYWRHTQLLNKLKWIFFPITF